MFREFFGSTSPFAEYFGSEGQLSVDVANRGAQGPAKLPALEKDLFCSLEELYVGATKKVKIVRQVYNAQSCFIFISYLSFHLFVSFPYYNLSEQYNQRDRVNPK